MENFDGINTGDRLRIIGGTYDSTEENGWHYIRTGAEVTVVRLTSRTLYVTPVDPEDWIGYSYSGTDTNAVRAQDVERAAPRVTLDDQWRPPVGTEVVIIAGHRGGSDYYHGFRLGDTVTITGLGDRPGFVVASGTVYYAAGTESYAGTQNLRAGDYRLPDGVEGVLPTPPLTEAEALEAFKRKTVTDALAARVRFGLDHANMIAFLTDDLGLGAYLPGTKVQVTMEVEVPAGGTAAVRAAALEAVRRGEGTQIGRATIIG